MKLFKKRSIRPLVRPIGSKVGVIRLKTKNNKDEMATATIIGYRWDYRRGGYLYAIKYSDNTLDYVQEEEFWTAGETKK